MSLTTTAHASAQQQNSQTPKPTVVLVHGAWADASGWTPVIERLQQAGYTVDAPANPLRGLTSDAQYIASVLKQIKGPVILVGHSYGGAVITDAAVGDPNVKALVYIAAWAPGKGQSLASLMAMPAADCTPPVPTIATTYPEPGGGTGTEVTIDPAKYNYTFLDNELPAYEAEAMAAEQRPLSTDAVTRGVGHPGVGDDPVLVHGGLARPRDLPEPGTLHGRPGPRPHRPGQRSAPDHVHQSRTSDQPDRTVRRSNRRPLTSSWVPGPDVAGPGTQLPARLKPVGAFPHQGTETGTGMRNWHRPPTHNGGNLELKIPRLRVSMRMPLPGHDTGRLHPAAANSGSCGHAYQLRAKGGLPWLVAAPIAHSSAPMTSASRS